MSHRLLVADDSQTIQRVVRLAFEGEDVEVVAAGTGAEAIRRIEEAAPTVVLADTRMPERDGYEVAEFLHGLGDTPIPVVLMAGAFEAVDDERARAAGCEHFLVKPFEPGQLVSTVRGLLPTEASPPPPVPGRTVATTPADALRLPAEHDLTWPVAEDRVSLAPSPADPGPTPGSAAPPSASVVPDPSPAPAPAPVASDPAPVATREPEPSPATPPAPTPSADWSDSDIDRLATRVIARMSDRVVRETTREVVGDTAERLVREELERIKTAFRGE